MAANYLLLKNPAMMDDFANCIAYQFGLKDAPDGAKLLAPKNVCEYVVVRMELLIWEAHHKKLSEELNELLMSLELQELDDLMKSFDEELKVVDTDEEKITVGIDEESGDEEDLFLYMENYDHIPQEILAIEEMIEDGYYFCI